MLNQDYKEMLQCLKKEGVEFLIVGAYAMAAHGFPRSTADFDIWVNPTPENAARVYRALSIFGTPVGDLTPNDFSGPGVEIMERFGNHNWNMTKRLHISVPSKRL